jgi:hypothetical protein
MNDRISDVGRSTLEDSRRKAKEGAIMSLKFHIYALLSCVAVLGSTRAQSTSSPIQAPTQPESTQNAKAEVASLNELMNADVVLANDATGQANTAPGRGHAERQIGRVKDLVLATHNGDIAWAVLSVSGSRTGGSQTILVPASSLKCTTLEGKLCYELRESEAWLKGVPEFSIDQAKKQGLDRVLEQAHGSIPTASDPNAKPAGGDAKNPSSVNDKTAPTSAAAFPLRFMLASEFKTIDLMALDKEFGKVEGAAVDAQTNRVAYALVSHHNLHGGGESAFLMPLGASGWARANNKSVLTSSKTAQQLSFAPEYQKPEKAFATPDQLRRADEFFGQQGVASGM